MSFILTPNMSLNVPVVGNEPGPLYATDVNNSLVLIDAHSHVAGQGVLITPAALNINADLTFQNNNAINLRSSRYTSQVSPLALPADIGCIYVSGVDLYYNDVSGNQIRITQSGSVAGASGTITGLPSGTASASYAAGTFTFQSATATSANIDGGSFVLRNATPSSFGLTLQPPNAMTSNYTVTLPAPNNLGSTGVLIYDTSQNIGFVTYDQVGQNMTSVGADAIQASTTRPVGSPAGLGGIAVSPSCGNFISNSSSFANIGVSATITTSGRPVKLGLQSDFSGNRSFVDNAGNIMLTQWVRNGVGLNNDLVGIGSDVAIPPGSFGLIDFVAAGTYTYQFQIRATSGSNNMAVSFCVITAYEL